MTVDAGDPVQAMLALVEIVTLFLLLVAFQAGGVGEARRLAFGIEDLRRIAAGIHVLFPRPVAGLTAFLGLFVLASGLRHVMDRGGILLVDVFVASFAGFGSHVGAGLLGGLLLLLPETR